MNIQIGAFIHLTYLSHLILSNNPLSPLLRLDSVSTHLQHVDISHIGLKEIPAGINPFVSINNRCMKSDTQSNTYHMLSENLSLITCCLRIITSCCRFAIFA